jgi:hypothetical protein
MKLFFTTSQVSALFVSNFILNSYEKHKILCENFWEDVIKITKQEIKREDNI